MVVTGPRTPIGRGASVALARRGARVGLVGEPASAEDLDPEATADAGAITTVPSDLRLSTDAEQAFGEVARRLGPIDALVHAEWPRSAYERVPLAETEDKRWDEIWEQGMRTALACLRAAYGHLKGRDGHIVMVTPTIAMSGADGLSAGAALAEGQRLLAKSAARQWGPDGVTVNCVAPSPPTGQAGSLFDAALRGGDVVADIGPVVAFLVSGASHYLTGATLCVDGGTWMAP